MPIEKFSFINFFYGNNGAGKSSIAYAIDEDEGLTWADGRSRDDYDVLVYNRDFVEENFSSYGNLKGVFIVNKVNKEIQAQIDAKTEEKKKLDGEFIATQDEWHKKSDAQGTLFTSFQNECWDKTVDLRADFAEALEDKGRQLKKDIGAITTDISKLNLQVVNTEAAITGINKILKDSGFQGFSLRAKPEVKDIVIALEKI